MPSKSEKQRRMMAAAANNPAFAAKVGIPVSVAQEYAKADQMRNGDRPFPSPKGGSAKKPFGRWR